VEPLQQLDKISPSRAGPSTRRPPAPQGRREPIQGTIALLLRSFTSHVEGRDPQRPDPAWRVRAAATGAPGQVWHKEKGIAGRPSSPITQSILLTARTGTPAGVKA